MNCSLSSRTGRRQEGMAVVVVLVVLAILLICIASGTRSLHSLDRELKRLEQRQTQRLKAMGGGSGFSTTNAPTSNPTGAPQ